MLAQGLQLVRYHLTNHPGENEIRMQSSNNIIQFKTRRKTKKSFQLHKKHLITGIAVTGLIALLVTHAHHVPADSEVDWLNRLADSGDNGAQLQLGLAYSNGLYGLKADKAAGQYWLKAAAEGGNHYAAQYLTNASADKQKISAREQTSLLQQLWHSAEANSPVSQTSEALLAHAKHGDPVAEYQLAMRYRDGAWAVKKDAKQSAYWLQRAADAGNPVAMKDLTALHSDAHARLSDKPPSSNHGGHV